MDIKSLNNLEKINGVYDLYTEVIVNNKKFNLYNFQCTDKHSMRIDLVCYDIYEDMDNIDILTNLNRIINPLSIYNGMTIYFPKKEDIEEIRSDSKVLEIMTKVISNANAGKTTKVDKNKQKDNINKVNSEKAKKLTPPHIKQSSNSNLDLGEQSIILKPSF